MRHTVQAGDTLGQIAQRYGVTTRDIIAVNPLANPDILLVGQELLIPAGSSGSAAASSSSSASSGSSGASAASSASGTYVVRSGDTLSKIADSYGVTLAALMEANGIRNADQIEVGRTLNIPGASSAPAARTGATSYTVKSGDTLFTIAVAHGVTTAALQQANGIVNQNQIYVGQVLTIP
jgi:lysozyme